LLALASLGGIALAAGLPGESEVTGGEPVEPAPAEPQPVSNAPAELLERLPVSRAVLELQAIVAPGVEVGSVGESGVSGRLCERVSYRGPGIQGPLRIEYTLDAELTRQVFRVLAQGRVQLGHVIVLEPGSGRVLAYASTNPEDFPPTQAYPAASLVKVITAAAALDARPETAELPCRFAGSPYRLTRGRIDPPKPSRGRTISLRRALATSNNQCFAQLAVHAVGGGPLLEAIARFGWLSPPAPAHAAGTADAGQDRYEVGKLGCGLGRSRITPLHAAQLAATLAHGELVAPRWIDRVVDAEGRELLLPAVSAPRRVVSPDLAAELRAMLVDTTTRGTARSAFRKRNGRPLLGPVRVAGKTGSLSGENPTGRYEWFIGVAPAEEPRIAVATLLVQGDLWWRNASQIAAEVLRRAFCTGRTCRPENAERWMRAQATTAALGSSRADALNREAL
jgi:cell division protein FtsI/penicillin-binding protein 2